MTVDEYEEWLEGRVMLSEVMSRAFNAPGGSMDLRDLLDALAEQMGLRTDTLYSAGYAVLEELRVAIEASLTEDGKGSKIEDIENSRPRKIAEAALSDLTLDTLADAMIQFGWGSQWLKGQTEVRNLAKEVRVLLAKQLNGRILNLLEAWRKGAVWNEALAWMAARNRRAP